MQAGPPGLGLVDWGGFSQQWGLLRRRVRFRLPLRRSGLERCHQPPYRLRNQLKNFCNLFSQVYKMNKDPKTKNVRKKMVIKRNNTINHFPTCSAKSIELTLTVSSAGELGGADGSGPF
jgi:hypothetical protein